MSISVNHKTFSQILGINFSDEEMNALKKEAKLKAELRQISDKDTFISGYLEARNQSDRLVRNIIEVPDFQREFVWKEGSQIRDLWSDIEDVLISFNDDNKIKNHIGLFLGNIIFLDYSEKFEVIDGQQRFTSIFILISAFRTWLLNYRDYLISNNLNDDISKVKNLTENLNNSLYNIGSNGQKKWRFRGAIKIRSLLEILFDSDWYESEKNNTLNENTETIPDEDFLEIKLPYDIDEFRNENFSDDWSKDEKNVIAIYRYFLRQINSFFKTNPDNYIHLYEIIHNLQFVQVIVDDEKDAYVFFERTNSRGQTLEVVDLLKAYIFGSSTGTQINSTEIKQDWKDIIPDPSDVNKNKTFVTYFYNRLEGTTSHEKNLLFGNIKNLYTHKNQTDLSRQDNILRLVSDLKEFSYFFNLLMRQKFNKVELKKYIIDLEKLYKGESTRKNKFLTDTGNDIGDVCRALQALSFFKIKIHIPLTHSLLHTFFSFGFHLDSNLVDNIVMLFRNLELLHFRIKVVETSPGVLQPIYNRYAAEFSKILTNSKILKAKKALIYPFKLKQAQAFQKKQKSFAFNDKEHDVRITKSEAEYIIKNSDDYKLNDSIVDHDLNLKDALRDLKEFDKAKAFLRYKKYLQALAKISNSTSYLYGWETYHVQLTEDDAHKIIAEYQKYYEMVPCWLTFEYKGISYNLKKPFLKYHKTKKELFKHLQEKKETGDEKWINTFNAIHHFYDYLQARAITKGESTFLFYDKKYRVSTSVTLEDASKIISESEINTFNSPTMFIYKGLPYDMSDISIAKMTDFVVKEMKDVIVSVDPDPETRLVSKIKEFYNDIGSEDTENKLKLPSNKQNFIEKFREIKFSVPNKLYLQYIFDRINNFRIGSNKNELIQVDEGDRKFIFHPERENKTSFTLDHFFADKLYKTLEIDQPEWINDIGNLVIINGQINSGAQADNPSEKIGDMSREKRSEGLRETYWFLNEMCQKYSNRTFTSADVDEYGMMVEKRTREIAEFIYESVWQWNKDVKPPSSRDDEN